MKKQRIFIDTNIILDLLLERKDFYEYAAKIFQLSIEEKIYLYTSSISISNIAYIIQKEVKNQKKIKEYIRELLSLVNVLSVDEGTIKFAIHTEFIDFEDSLQYSCAFENNMDFIITRDKKDYKTSKIKVLDSKEFIERN